MSRTALLILTQPLSRIKAQLPFYLTEISRLVTKTAYIHIQPDNIAVPARNSSETDSVSTSSFQIFRIPFTTEIRSIIKELYVGNAKTCSSVDIRVLVGHIKNTNLNLRKYDFKDPCDLVMTDRDIGDDEVSNLLKTVSKCFNLTATAECQRLQNGISGGTKDPEVASSSPKRPKLEVSGPLDELQQYPHTVLGGTFDRLHVGHKILLTEGCLLGTEKLTVGVTHGKMNKKKVLMELIQSTDKRIKDVKEFLEDIKPCMVYNVVPITDGFGPTVDDPDMDLIVLSEETKKGGEMINTEREKKGFKRLLEYTIELIEDACHSQFEEAKISSSSGRKRLLGTLYHSLKKKEGLPEKPYIIGLTGGIASGKSSVCKRLEGQGAKIVDCDKLGHRAYVKGTSGFDKVVTTFGDQIIGEDGEVNRKELGKIVFGNKAELQKLNEIVWPEIAKLAQEQISDYAKGGHNIIVLDAAILLEAGWDAMCHEVWTTMVPQDEAVKRMVERNNLTEEQARQRIGSQISNMERVEKSNVILCTLWEYEYTQQQVERAWRLLLQRLPFQWQDVKTKSNM